MMNEETTANFIEVVHSNECLWSVTSKAYKNKLLREDLWKSIGEQFNMTGDEAYSNFRRLREKYRREKEKNHGKSGAAASRSSNWPFLKSLEFLDEAYKKRKVSNSQSWSACETIITSEVDEVLVSVAQPQLPHLTLTQRTTTQQTPSSRSRSKTPGNYNAVVEAMHKSTERMVEALKSSPHEGVLGFLKETFNELEEAKAEELERKIMQIAMAYKYSK